MSDENGKELTFKQRMTLAVVPALLTGLLSRGITFLATRDTTPTAPTPVTNYIILPDGGQVGLEEFNQLSTSYQSAQTEIERLQAELDALRENPAVQADVVSQTSPTLPTTTTEIGERSFWDEVPFSDQQGTRARGVNDRIENNRISNAHIYGAGWSDAWTKHDLDGRYRVLRASVGIIDGSAHRRDFTLIFTKDGCDSVYFDISVDDDMPRDITVDLTGVSQLEIRVHVGRPNVSVSVAVANAVIY